MSDPLRLISTTSTNPALPRVGAAGAGSAESSAGAGAAGGGGGAFKDVLLANIKQVNDLQNQATTAIEDLQTGDRTDLEGVLLATQKADLAFRTLMAVRNKVAAAYEEVKQMRV